MLIGSYHAENVFLITPLVKWYLKNGLVVTRVYEFVKFKPVACFTDFCDSVSNYRRQGDRDPSKGLLAETAKLIGNSVYGKLDVIHQIIYLSKRFFLNQRLTE